MFQIPISHQALRSTVGGYKATAQQGIAEAMKRINTAIQAGRVAPKGSGYAVVAAPKTAKGGGHIAKGDQQAVARHGTHSKVSSGMSVLDNILHALGQSYTSNAQREYQRLLDEIRGGLVSDLQAQQTDAAKRLRFRLANLGGGSMDQVIDSRLAGARDQGMQTIDRSVQDLLNRLMGYDTADLTSYGNRVSQAIPGVLGGAAPAVSAGDLLSQARTSQTRNLATVRGQAPQSLGDYFAVVLGAIGDSKRRKGVAGAGMPTAFAGDLASPSQITLQGQDELNSAHGAQAFKGR